MIIRRCLLVLCMSLCISPAWAEDSIAVMDFDVLVERVTIAPGYYSKRKVIERSRLLSNALISYLVESGKLKVLERQYIQDVLNEHGLTAPDWDTYNERVGKLLGADYLVLGKLESLRIEEGAIEKPYEASIPLLESELRVHLRLVHTPSGRIVIARDFKIPYIATLDEGSDAQDYLRNMKAAVAEELGYAILAELYPEEYPLQRDDEIVEPPPQTRQPAREKTPGSSEAPIQW